MPGFYPAHPADILASTLTTRGVRGRSGGYSHPSAEGPSRRRPRHTSRLARSSSRAIAGVLSNRTVQRPSEISMPLKLAESLPPAHPASSSFTVGVEEELFLVDPATLRPVRCSGDLLKPRRFTRGAITGEMCDGVV